MNTDENNDISHCGVKRHLFHDNGSIRSNLNVKQTNTMITSSTGAITRVNVRCLRNACWVFASCILLGLLCEVLYLKHESCQESDSLNQIQELCSQYHNKEIIGNMCSSLCDKAIFRLNRCHGNKLGKKVLIMECVGCIEPGITTNLVLKAEYDMVDWQRKTPLNLTGALPRIQDKVTVATERIRVYTRGYYDTDLSEHGDVISFILGENYQEAAKRLNISGAIDVVLRTAISLGSQEEFLSFRILGPRSFLPKLYGTCGQAYFVENTPSFSSLSYIYFTAKKPDLLTMKIQGVPWEKRARAALSLLNMVPEIEDTYTSALQICDVQPHNFGVSESGATVMLDSDSLKFGQVVYDRACENDRDCRFITCLGKCNQTRKWCEKQMTTNNLQVICRRLFVTEHDIFGLLRGAPGNVRQDLRDVLKRCMDPEERIFKLPRENKSDRKILQELQSLLQLSIR